MTLASRIAHYVHTTGFDDMAPAVIERAKDLCISSVGSAVLGATMDTVMATAAYVRSRGGAAEASLIGMGFSTTVELAAMVNCNASHCTEFEDVAWPEAQYTCCLIPAMLSLGEALKASGRDVLEAIVLGFEVAARPGMVCSNHGAAARGFLSCANNGTLGVAAGAARLMELSERQTRDAITLAASMAGGLVRQTGSAAHVVEAGFTARDGITAAALAARGVGGNPAILDGKAGFFDALAGQPEIAFDLGRGEDFRIMAVGQKKFPCCYLLQRIIDTLRDMVAAHGLDPAMIAEVRIDVNGAFPSIVKYPEPADVEEARFSLPHVVAAALCGEPMDFRTFTAEKLTAPSILALRGRIYAEVHADWGFDQLGARDEITIRLTSGETLRRTCTTAHGDAVDPLSRQETIAKFLTCTDNLLLPARQQQIVAGLERLETLADVSTLFGMLSDVPPQKVH